MTRVIPAVVPEAADNTSSWLEFFAFSSINVVFVLVGCMLLGTTAGVLGCYGYLRKRSLLGDTLAHAALPGICAAFLLTGAKDPLILLLGAVISCWLGAIAVDMIVAYTRCKEDSALGMVLSVFFGVGILMLTHIQQTDDAAQSGLDKFLFGQAAALIDRDLWTLLVMSCAILSAVVLAHKEFKVVSFDPAYAGTIGMPARLIEVGLATLMVLAVAIGLQAVGVVLMAALLVTPAAAARFWTDRLGRMLLIAAGFGAASGALGTYISYLSPKMPTGPWMVIAASAFFAFSLFSAPRRGVVARAVRAWRFRRNTAEENILRSLYRFGEKQHEWSAAHTTGELLRFRPMSAARLNRTLSRLKAQLLVYEGSGGQYGLSEAGVARAARVTRLHRLWELYLTRHLEIAPDHVHDDADEIEHIITPELEEQLAAALESPHEDPHARQIPWGGTSAPRVAGPARNSPDV